MNEKIYWHWTIPGAERVVLSAMIEKHSYTEAEAGALAELMGIELVKIEGSEHTQPLPRDSRGL